MEGIWTYTEQVIVTEYLLKIWKVSTSEIVRGKEETSFLVSAVCHSNHTILSLGPVQIC